jgi:hypothetical protein
MYSLSQQYNNWNIGQNWLVVDQFVLTTVQVDIAPLIGLCTPSGTAGGDLSEWLKYAKVHPYNIPLTDLSLNGLRPVYAHHLYFTSPFWMSRMRQ